MFISLVITVLLLYVAFNTKFDGEKLPNWGFYAIAALTLCSWESALVMLAITIWMLYRGVRNGEISTLEWIENLIK